MDEIMRGNVLRKPSSTGSISTDILAFALPGTSRNCEVFAIRGGEPAVGGRKVLMKC